MIVAGMHLVLHSIGRHCCHPETSKLSITAQPLAFDICSAPGEVAKTLSVLLQFLSSSVPQCPWAALQQHADCHFNDCTTLEFYSVDVLFSRNTITSITILDATITKRYTHGKELAIRYSLSAIASLSFLQRSSSCRRPSWLRKHADTTLVRLFDHSNSETRPNRPGLRASKCSSNCKDRSCLLVYYWSRT